MLTLLKSDNKNIYINQENQLLINNIYLPKTNEIINKKANIILDYIYLAKIMAAFSVVLLHANGSFWNFKYNEYKKYWKSCNLMIGCHFIFL